jgi:TPR repeat protein
MKRLHTLILCCFLISLTAIAGLDKGLAAAQKGDFATALREWKPLAEQGDARAQFKLGAIYA